MTVLLLDHVLDRKTGLDLYNNVKDTQIKFNIKIVWVLLSSTEDLAIIDKYKNVGFE